MRTPQRQSSSNSISKYSTTMHGETLISAPTSTMFDRRMKMERPMTLMADTSAFDTDLYHPLIELDYSHSPLPLPPHISLHHPSEPASPITVSSTLSHTSSPSPSPSRGVVVSDPMSADFLLFDDSVRTSPVTHAQKRVQGHRRYGSASSFASDTSLPSTSNPSQFQHNIYPVIAQADAFSQGTFGGNNYMMQQDPSTLIDLSKQTPKSSQQLLRPPFQFNGAQMFMQHHGQSDDDEPVPGLSPASRNTQFHSGRPSISSDGFRSPRSPARTPDYPDISHNTPRIFTPHQASVTSQMANTDIHGMGFSNIFQKAQQAHTIDQTSPIKHIARDRSPFRMSSPYHTNVEVHQDMSNLYPVRIPTAHDQRVKQQQEFAAAEVLRKQMEAEAASAETPKTISPKDAMLDYHEPENQNESQRFFQNMGNDRTPINYDIYSSSFYPTQADNETEASFGSMATSRRESGSAMSNASLYRTPSNQLNFNALQTPVQTYARTTPTQMPIPRSAVEADTSIIAKPPSKANAGSYTCTSDNCGQRFTTSAKLQRHRREAHRLSTPGVAPGIGSGMSSAAVAARNAQPGPHKCNRVNPSTGKPCSIVFSRPYDLTRHEDTIHNNIKEKVRCEICTDEKSFSRYDALVRHKRVKHGIVDRH